VRERVVETINWRRHGVGKRFEHADLSHVDQKHFEVVFEYQTRADKLLRDGRGLLLSGPPGIGKTYSMTALMKALRKVRGSRFDFLFVTAPLLFERVANRERDEFRAKAWLDVYTSIPALVINDLGKEDRSKDWKAEELIVKLGRVLRQRHEDALSIFITTNIPLVAPKANQELPTFESVYGDSLWSLVYDMTFRRAQITAPDRRRTLTADA
jgi:DNA replication protein DnaC